MTRPILKGKIGLKFQSYPTFEDVVNKTFLAIINSGGAEVYVAKIDEFGALRFPDTDDDIGWLIEDVTLWADLSDVYDAADRYFVMPGE